MEALFDSARSAIKYIAKVNGAVLVEAACRCDTGGGCAVRYGQAQVSVCAFPSTHLGGGLLVVAAAELPPERDGLQFAHDHPLPTPVLYF